jgi:hypothetical protein
VARLPLFYGNQAVIKEVSQKYGKQNVFSKSKAEFE